jgi:hypothetical protein
MFAELHLAEDALALHLFLQHSKRLVDIIVANENLHEAVLSNRIPDLAYNPEEVQRGFVLCDEGPFPAAEVAG